MRRDRKMLWQYLQDYRFNSILVRSFLTILLVLLLSFAGIMLLVSWQLNRNIQREAGTMSLSALDKTQERMDTVMDEVVRISGQLSMDPDILNFLLPGGGTGGSPMVAARDKAAMYADVFDYIDSIYVYSSKNHAIVTDQDGGAIETFSDLTWYDNLVEREYEPARMIGRMKEDNYPYLLSYLQPVRLSQVQLLGGIIINIDADKLDEMVVAGTGDGTEELLIADQRGNILFSSQTEHRMKRLSQLEHAQTLASCEGYEILQEGEEELVISAVESETFPWRYISVVPMDAFRAYQSSFRGFYLLMSGLILLISVAAAFLISFYCYLPVKNILDLMKNPDLYEKSFETGLRRDEAHEIGMNIIRNLYSNQQMQQEMNRYITIIDKAHVTALQAQISPHFLYNTLENIRWRAMELCQGDNEVSQTILNLSRMLRISLDNEKQIIPLREELENARLYTEILLLRYQDKMQVFWDVEESTGSLPMVKITLQPLIENAFYHGIKPMREAGEIRVSAQRLAEEVEIRVADNGVGMDENEVEQLNRDMREKYLLRQDHIGVRNVNQRLKLLLGVEAGVEVRSRKGKGTVVILRIPWS